MRRAALVALGITLPLLLRWRQYQFERTLTRELADSLRGFRKEVERVFEDHGKDCQEWARKLEKEIKRAMAGQ